MQPLHYLLHGKVKNMESKQIKLSPKKNGKGYVTSYSINLGCAEVRECGFIDDDGFAVPIEKIVDPKNSQIIIRLASNTPR